MQQFYGENPLYQEQKNLDRTHYWRERFQQYAQNQSSKSKQWFNRSRGRYTWICESGSSIQKPKSEASPKTETGGFKNLTVKHGGREAQRLNTEMDGR